MHRSLKTPAIAALGLLAASCGEPADAPYVEIVGGGFIFNYRIAEAFYGFVAKPRRAIPAGTVLEAEFEDPAGGAPILVREAAETGKLQYSFRTPPIKGVKTERDYKVELRLIDPATNQVLARYGRTYRSNIDQALLPDQPLTVGPGYHPNPALPAPDAGRKNP